MKKKRQIKILKRNIEMQIKRVQYLLDENEQLSKMLNDESAKKNEYLEQLNELKADNGTT